MSSFPAYRPRLRPAFFLPQQWPLWLALGVLRLGVYLPRRLWSGLGAGLGVLYYGLNRKRRRIARANIDLCFPELTPAARGRLLRAHFRVAVQSALDLGWLWWGSERRLAQFVRMDGLEHYRAAVTAGRRVILLTCHSVALEMGGVISRYYPQVAIFKQTRNPVINWLIARGRMRFNAQLYTRAQGIRPVVRAIQRGASFYYLPDEDLGLDNAVFAPFFGTPAATLTTVGRIARLCDAAVLPFFVRRRADGRGYDVEIKAALAGFPSDNAARDAATVNLELERGIRAAPAQYMWTFKRFKTRPPGMPSPYDA